MLYSGGAVDPLEESRGMDMPNGKEDMRGTDARLAAVDGGLSWIGARRSSSDFDLPLL